MFWNKTFYILKHRDNDELSALKKGFSWPGLIFGFWWAALYEMWPIAGALFLFTYGLKIAEYQWSTIESPVIALSMMVVSLCALLAPGFFGNRWRLHYLQKGGFELVDKVRARSMKAALAMKEDKLENIALEDTYK